MIPKELQPLTERKKSAPYLPRLLHSLSREAFAVSGVRGGLSWLNETRLVSFETKQKQVRIWNTTTGETQWLIELQQPIEKLQSLPDGRGLVVCFSNKQVAVIDPEWGTQLSSIQASKAEGTRENPFTSLVVSPDGAMIYIAHGQDPPIIAWRPGEEAIAWSALPEKMSARWNGLKKNRNLISVALSTNSRRLIAFYQDSIVQYDSQTGRVLSRVNREMPSYEDGIIDGIVIGDNLAVYIARFYEAYDKDWEKSYSMVNLWDLDKQQKIWSKELPDYKEDNGRIFWREPYLICSSCVEQHTYDLTPSKRKTYTTDLEFLHATTGESADEILFWPGHFIQEAALSPGKSRLAVTTNTNQILIFSFDD